MNASPFALEWIVFSYVFGKLREIPAHDSYESEDEVIEHADHLL
jgi:hypothetical protein